MNIVGVRTHLGPGFQARDRAFRVALLELKLTQVVVGIRARGILLDHVPQKGLGFLFLLDLNESKCQVIFGGNIGRTLFERGAQLVHGILRVAIANQS